MTQLIYNLKDRKLADIDIVDLNEMSTNSTGYLGAVFMDNSSFMNIIKDAATTCENNSINEVRKNPKLFSNSVLGFLQSIVIYDNIITDGYVLANNSDSYKLAYEFKEIIRALWMNDKIRDNIVKSVNEEAKTLEENLKIKKRNKAIGDSITAYTDKYLFDGLEDEIPIGRINYDDLTTTLSLPAELQTSDNHVLRTLYYDQVSTIANIPYSPHLGRVKILEEVQKSRIKSVRIGVLNFVQSEIKELQSKMKDFYNNNFEINIPLIAEYVISKAGNINEITSIALEIRNSKEALAFRRWCNKFQLAITNGQVSVSEANKIFIELSNATKKWTNQEPKLSHSAKLKFELGLTGPKLGIEVTTNDFIGKFKQYHKLRLLKKVIRNS